MAAEESGSKICNIWQLHKQNERELINETVSFAYSNKDLFRKKYMGRGPEGAGRHFAGKRYDRDNRAFSEKTGVPGCTAGEPEKRSLCETCKYVRLYQCESAAFRDSGRNTHGPGKQN